MLWIFSTRHRARGGPHAHVHTRGMEHFVANVASENALQIFIF
nr:MAG TPA: hypothetical protein [Caudoviricetes sp.]